MNDKHDSFDNPRQVAAPADFVSPLHGLNVCAVEARGVGDLVSAREYEQKLASHLAGMMAIQARRKDALVKRLRRAAEATEFDEIQAYREELNELEKRTESLRSMQRVLEHGQGE